MIREYRLTSLAYQAMLQNKNMPKLSIYLNRFQPRLLIRLIFNIHAKLHDLQTQQQ